MTSTPQAARPMTEPEPEARIAVRIAAWHAMVRRDFLRAYGRHIAGTPTHPDDPAFAAALLDLFAIQKAAYEVVYELANRPAWVNIPLRGILALLEGEEPAP